MSNWVFDAGRVLPARSRRYYDAEELMALPAPKWLIQGYIPENSLGVLYGPPKIGKSFLALDWAVRLAKELPWLECPTSKNGRTFVMYMLGEGISGIGQRLKAWESYNETPIAGKADMELVDTDLETVVSKDTTPLIFPDKIVNFSNMNDAKAFTEDLLAIFEPPPALIIVDTFARAMAGADENSVQDVSQVIAYADAVRAATGSSILFVHHSTKADEAKERGSSALRGAVDYMIALRGTGDGKLLLDVEYTRDFEAPEPKELILKAYDPSAVIISPEALGPNSVPLSKGQLKILEILRDVGESGISASLLIEASGMPQVTAYKALKGLRDRGHIQKGAGLRGRYALTV